MNSGFGALTTAARVQDLMTGDETRMLLSNAAMRVLEAANEDYQRSIVGRLILTARPIGILASFRTSSAETSSPDRRIVVVLTTIPRQVILAS